MNINSNCQKCQGTGQISGSSGPVSCDRCAATGRVDDGEISNVSQTLDERLTDVEDKINDITVLCNDILEKLNE